MKAVVLFSLLVAAASGCSPDTRSGDFGNFLISEIGRLGGHRQGTNALPTLRARWSAQSDTNGFEIHLPDIRFNEIGSFLRQAYGEPHSTGTNRVGQAWMLYSAMDIGVAIHLFSEQDGCVLNGVRGFKSTGEMLDNIEKRRPWPRTR